MTNSDTSFERFAKQYDEDMGDTGSYNHQHTIDPPLFDLIGSPKDLVIYDIACVRLHLDLPRLGLCQRTKLIRRRSFFATPKSTLTTPCSCAWVC